MIDNQVQCPSRYPLVTVRKKRKENGGFVKGDFGKCAFLFLFFCRIRKPEWGFFFRGLRNKTGGEILLEMGDGREEGRGKSVIVNLDIGRCFVCLRKTGIGSFRTRVLYLCRL